MKTKIKRHYRSAVSVLLSVCMLISCMTVGLIATDAARIDADEAVGSYNSPTTIYFKASSEWAKDNATFKANFYENDTYREGKTLTLLDSTNKIYYVTVPENRHKIQFLRLSSDGNSEWNFDTTTSLPGTNNLYTINSGDGNDKGGSWSRYTTFNSPYLYYSTSTDQPSAMTSSVSAVRDGNTVTATINGPFTSGTKIRTIMCAANDMIHNLFNQDSCTAAVASGSTDFISESAANYYDGSLASVKYAKATVKSGQTIQSLTVTVDLSTKKYTYSAVPANATVTPAVTPAGSGTAEISSTENGTYSTSPLENIDLGSNVYLRATPAAYYEFSEWEAVSGLTFTDRTQSTAQAVTVSGSATAKAKFVKTKYNVTAGTFDHGTISVPSSPVAWETTVTPTVTPERGYKVNKLYTSTDGGTTWTEEASSTSFEMPKSNVMVKAEMVAATEYTVNFSGVNGTVTAMESDGTPVTNGGTVYEGTEVTFTATPNTGYLFTGWSGLDGNTSIASKTITENTTVTATFVKEGYHLLRSGGEEKMVDLSNGLFITSSKKESGYYFKIKRDADSKRSKGTNSSDKQDLDSLYKKYDVSGWEDDNGTWNNSYCFKNNTGQAAYVVYDSINDRVYLTTDSKGYYDVKVYLKRGTVRSGFTTTALFGEFTQVKDGSSSGSSISTTDTSGYSYIKEFTVSAAAIRAAADAGNSKKVYIKAQTTDDYKDNYFVQGFDVNGGLTRSVISQFDGNGDAINTDKILSSGNSWNEFVLDVGGYADNEIVVTLIYGPKVASSSDVVRFYAYDFAGEVKDKWGGYLAAYPYITDSYNPFADYPGQLMINEGGTYYTEVPTKKPNTDELIQGMTLNNYTWDDFVYDKFLKEKANEEFNSITALSGKTLDETKRMFYNRQTYDYDEFKIINNIFQAKKAAGEYNGESIIYSFKYKANPSSNPADYSSARTTYTTSNLGQATYFDNDPDEITAKQTGTYGYRKTGYSSFTMEQINDSTKFQWEDLTDFYKHRVDIFGEQVDDVGNEDKQNYRPIRIISNGYDHNSVGYYATAWALYMPVDSSGAPAFDPDTTTLDHYELFEVIGGCGEIKDGEWKNGSESFLIDPDHTERIHCKYGDTAKLSDYIAAFKTKYPDAKVPDHILDCENVPVMITYEYEILGLHPNEVTAWPYSDNGNNKEDPDGLRHAKDGSTYYTIYNWGNRSDGRWYYSDSNQLLRAHTLIEIADKKNGPYVRDYYQTGNIDFESPSGYDSTKNAGLISDVTARFTNNNSFSRTSGGTTTTYTNVANTTEAYALSDNKSYFQLKAAVDADENYTFEGWYLKNGDLYSLVSNDPEYNVLAKTNDVYVARFYKTPGGAVKISHELLTGSVGTADTLNSVQIVESDGTTVVDTLSTENENATVVKSKYIKADSTNKIKIVINTDPATGFGLDNFWYDYTKRTDTDPADVTKLVNQTADPTDPESVESFNVSVDIENKTATILVPVKYFFADDPDISDVKMFDTSKDQLRFFSKLKVTGKDLTITKTVTAGTPTTTNAFSVKVETSSNGTDWTNYQSKPYTSTNSEHNGTTDENGIASIYCGETITFPAIPVNTYVKITETSIYGKYQFISIAAEKDSDATTAASFTTENITNGCSFQITDDKVNVTVQNELEIAYEITYTYDSRSNLIKTTTANPWTPKYGTPSYTVNGTGLYSEILEHSDTLSKDIIKKNVAESSDRVPYEKNFMQTMEWDFDNINYSKDKGTNSEGYDEYYCTVRGENKDEPKVSVTFVFPYDSDAYTVRDYDDSVETNTVKGTIFGPKDTPSEFTDETTQTFSNQSYQSNPIVYAKRTRTYVNDAGQTITEEYDAKFGTFAAPSVDGDEFAYWSICVRDSINPGTNDSPNYVEVARCYETTFNYALFDDYRVYAKYKIHDHVDTEGKAKDKYTTINFLDYSRNHWNNSDRGGYPSSYDYIEGDVIWTDFDVAFEYGNILINNTSAVEVGVLFTKVQDSLDVGQEFNPGADNFATQYQYYYEKYNHDDDETCENEFKKSTWVEAAKNYIKGTNIKASTRDDGIYSKRVLNSTLTNKNRTEYGYAWAINSGAASAEIVNARRNGLYRAVTYMRNGDDIILSDTPVYLCLSNEASQTPVSPAPTP